jgi:hypothetical protein
MPRALSPEYGHAGVFGFAGINWGLNTFARRGQPLECIRDSPKMEPYKFGLFGSFDNYETPPADEQSEKPYRQETRDNGSSDDESLPRQGKKRT